MPAVGSHITHGGLVFEVDVPEGASDDEVHDRAIELAEKVDALHWANSLLKKSPPAGQV